MYLIQKEFIEGLDKDEKEKFDKLRAEYKKLKLSILIGKKFLGMTQLGTTDVSMSLSVYASKIKVFEFIHKNYSVLLEQMKNFINEYEIGDSAE